MMSQQEQIVIKLVIPPSVADNTFRANYSKGLIVVFAQTSPPDVITTHLTLDEYWAMKETNPERHEYRNGEIRDFQKINYPI